ncbi:flagellar motor switch protein FliG [Chitinimonas viridis]|uniref:Flagellar motor switch protein FliG n=2 Tax=Chitinimonas TaxID=240411 RepID=A0ABT8B346_9NEIS|nr:MULTISPECIES: flagellar motor switch protein FliG [Chitinimonas]MBL8508375.1 flagellar motor switch protein FliG [Chitinimonas sp.]MDN3576250.1 flagellar motor switch protein FliG [Chitinimonas viridis]GLR14543.1 flagellar motor switch protein G [Chitinimonas prasina]
MAANDEAIRRSAILLMSLGEEAAVEVFKYLGPKEVQKIGLAMASMDNVTREQVEEVVGDFLGSTMNRANFGAADEYIRSVLTKALGSDKAANLLDRILQGGDNTGIESLKWMDSVAVAELIKNEHPQIIATILVHLEPDQVSEVLNQFVERLRNDVLLRIATLEGVQPTALRELNDVLTQLLSGADRVKKSAMGGEGMAAEILNFMGGVVEASAINAIREYDPELAQRIQDKMFTFENLIDIDDRGIQLLLREISSDSLITAMKGTSEILRTKIFKNMSQRAAEMLRDDFEAKGAVKVSEVEAEQREILKVVRRLADEGQIAIAKGGGEGFVE